MLTKNCKNEITGPVPIPESLLSTRVVMARCIRFCRFYPNGFPTAQDTSIQENQPWKYSTGYR